MLFGHTMNIMSQLFLFLKSHRKRIGEFTYSCCWSFLLFLGLGGWHRWFDWSFLYCYLNFSRYAIVVFLKLIGDFDEVFVGFVKQVAVMENFDYVIMELGWVLVFSAFQFGFNGRQVHGLLYYLAIFWDVQAVNIDRCEKRPPAGVMLQQLEILETWFQQFINQFLFGRLFLNGRWQITYYWFRFGEELSRGEEQQLICCFFFGLSLAVFSGFDLQRIVLGEKGGDDGCLFGSKLKSVNLCGLQICRLFVFLWFILHHWRIYESNRCQYIQIIFEYKR